ncbi:hypothetical protein BU15DRAFT_61453 [Melanogaster broomeanus]|nr:hypothetical protein BU15DRAFT_61453 [Melanogaster broomeanus]
MDLVRSMARYPTGTSYEYGAGSVYGTGSAASGGGLVMEERYAGILAALHTGERFGTGNSGGAREAYVFPLSPPPPALTTPRPRVSQPAPPTFCVLFCIATEELAGPGRVRVTMGSGSGSGSVDALTRTRTGSEEPLLGIGKSSEVLQGTPGGGGGGDTTAVGTEVPVPYIRLCKETLRARATRKVPLAAGRLGTPVREVALPSSFDVLRSVSSQGGLSSVYSHGQGQTQGFTFGFGGPGSSSSASTGKKRGSYGRNFGNPPTSFRAWKERTSRSEKEKDMAEKGEKDRRSSTGSSTSASASTGGNGEDKKGRTSPALGVRAFLGRLRRAGHTPSPRSSNRDLSSPPPPRSSVDVDHEKAVGDEVTPPPSIQFQVATPQRQYSFVLSNPDPHPPSPYSGTGDAMPSSDASPHDEELHGTHATLPPGYMFGTSAPTEESHHTEGLLHPRLQFQGHSGASLRDFEDLLAAYRWLRLPLAPWKTRRQVEERPSRTPGTVLLKAHIGWWTSLERRWEFQVKAVFKFMSRTYYDHVTFGDDFWLSCTTKAHHDSR